MGGQGVRVGGGKWRLPIREGRHCVPLVVRRCARMTCMPYRRRQSAAPKSGAPKSVRSAAAEQSLDIDGIHLHLTRKPIKNLYLRIKPPSGRVEISAPMRMSESRIADYVKERHSWILAQQQRMAEAQRRSIMALNEGAGFENGGRGVAGASGHDGGVAGRPKTGDISRPGIGDSRPGQAGTNVQPYFDRSQIWTDERKRQAAAAINAALPQLLAKWGPVVGRQPTHITLRVMTSRWGSCTPRTGRIRLNLQLGLMEPQFLEYVLVHEMTHLWESGHGAGFQRRMTAYLPGWKTLRRDLNRRVVL